VKPKLSGAPKTRSLRLQSIDRYITGMKHAGKARRAGLKIALLSLVIVVAVTAIWSFLAGRLLGAVAAGLGGLWLLFMLFSLSFFRDPNALVPSDEGAYVSPAHGTVDVIDETTEKVVMGGRCRRVSIFLSVFDVHVQNAPIGGRVTYVKHCPGKFVNAMRSDCGEYNEHVLVGIESDEAAEERLALRLIAGLIARRIVPWVAEGDRLVKGERISLIQFGSRVDLYMPLSSRVQVKLGQKVKGGETIIALRG
jgi:phosphatidylserine decarboxylase